MSDNRIIAAAHFAKAAHAGQTRKYNGRPYITHPARVAAKVTLLDGANDAMVCAAWLHDVVEDCGCTTDDLSRQFGPDVARIVWELTNPPKGDSGLNRAARKARDRVRLQAASREARRIKLVDRIDNLGEIHGADEDFRRLYGAESLALHEAILGTDAELEAELYAAIDALRVTMCY